MDLISRQAAIEAMMKLQAEDDEAYGCHISEGFDGERAKQALESLPSAQPKRTDKRTETHACDCISRRAAIEALDALCDRECEYSKKQRSVMCGACHLGSAFDVVEQLPSAQPKIEERKEESAQNVPKEDLISRKAAIEAMDGFNACGYVEEPFERLEKALEEIPAAEPERKTGKWLPDNRPGGGFWVCSYCKFPSEAFAANVLYKFCPNCGAYMGGDEGV